MEEDNDDFDKDLTKINCMKTEINKIVETIMDKMNKVVWKEEVKNGKGFEW